MTFEIDEGQRQLVLMALAHLAVERSGFDYALAEIALRIDNRTEAGRPEMYDGFKALTPETQTKCLRCDGCGQVADTQREEPWSAWLHLPLESAAAVLANIVRPKPCPQCKGSGKMP